MATVLRWLIPAVVAVAILFVSVFSRTVGFVMALTVAIAYLFVTRNKKVTDVVLVFLIFFCLMLGPVAFKNESVSWLDNLKKELKAWSDSFRRTGFDASYKDQNGKVFSISKPADQSIGAGDVTDTAYDSPKQTGSAFLANVINSTTKAQVAANLLNNADFGIPFESSLSLWGHGFHSDRIARLFPDTKVVWINFGGAKAKISVEPTEIGSALRIYNPDIPKDHRVGVMEQKIRVTPGIYRLSYWAKAEADFEARAVMFSTKDDWVRPLELPDPGPFDWKEFSHEIKIEKSGLVTFSIISQGKGTVYLTDVLLTRQSGDSK